MLLDHVVLFVDDLDDAVSIFSSYGFTVTPGGINGPTHNALIAFENETYIELIALRKRTTRRLFKFMRRLGLLRLRSLMTTDLNNRLFGWFSKPQGFRDICFRAASLEEVSRECLARGIPLTPIIPFNRHRPDGVTVSWYLAGAVNEAEPFFIEDKTPLNLRIPDGAARIHDNGALGITEIGTKVLLSFSVANASTGDNSGVHGKFGISIKTVSSARDLDLPSSYAANIRLVN
jgi:catechol 2,3-dioxygenase-like lactoylglutathione lyase family enzyme